MGLTEHVSMSNNSSVTDQTINHTHPPLNMASLSSQSHHEGQGVKINVIISFVALICPSAKWFKIIQATNRSTSGQG